jgi:hypothetical protein
MGMLTSYGLPLIPVSRPENKEIGLWQKIFLFGQNWLDQNPTRY